MQKPVNTFFQSYTFFPWHHYLLSDFACRTASVIHPERRLLPAGAASWILQNTLYLTARLGYDYRNRNKHDSDADKLCNIWKSQWRMGRVFNCCEFITTGYK